MKSKEWLDRQNRDFYVKKAKKIGYVSRSAYKILEIEKKFKLINNSKNILELGSAPGGWSQVVFELKDTVKMYAFDLLDMKFKHPNMKFIKENFLTYDYSKIPHKFDLILCLEVLEHIDNFKKTLQQITTLVKPKGTLVLSTINRNLKSLIFMKNLNFF